VTNEEFGAFLDGLPPSATPGAPPYIGVDECANSPMLFNAIGQLCNRNLASGAGPLWNQRRVRPDGSIVYVMGGLSRGWPVSDFLVSRRADYATWDDAKVVLCLLANFHGYDRLVLLSENVSAEVGGLHWLMKNNVEPVLAERHRQRFSLTVLFKDGRIDFAEYAARVTRFFELGQFGYGYAEWVLSRDALHAPSAAGATPSRPEAVGWKEEEKRGRSYPLQADHGTLADSHYYLIKSRQFRSSSVRTEDPRP